MNNDKSGKNLDNNPSKEIIQKLPPAMRKLYEMSKEELVKNGIFFLEAEHIEKEKLDDAKKFVREMERYNFDHIYLVRDDARDWLHAYDHSAHFYHVLNCKNDEIHQQKMLEPVSKMDPNELPKNRKMPEVKLHIDNKGKYRARFVVKIPNFWAFVNRMSYIPMTEDTPDLIPKDYYGYVRSFKLPAAFSKEDVKGFYNEEKMLQQRLNSITYGKNIQSDVVKILREIEGFMGDHISPKINKDLAAVKLDEAILGLHVKYMEMTQTSKPERLVPLALEAIRKSKEALLLLDVCQMRRLLDPNVADKIGIRIAKVREWMIRVCSKYDKRAVKDLELYEELESMERYGEDNNAKKENKKGGQKSEKDSGKSETELLD